MKKKGSKSDFTRQRDRELYAHFMDILSESRGVTLGAAPGLCMTRAVDEVVCEPAPRFYITDKSAKVIIYRIRRRIRLERNLKALRTR